MNATEKTDVLVLFGSWLIERNGWTQEDAQKEIDLIRQFRVIDRAYADIPVNYAVRMPRNGSRRHMNRREKCGVAELLQRAIEHQSFS